MGVALGTVGALAVGFASLFLCLQRNSFTIGQMGLVVTYCNFVSTAFSHVNICSVCVVFYTIVGPGPKVY